MSYDAIVVGLGAMGSAIAYHLSSRGVRVLGLDRFSPPHQLGSSHGKTRIIREAYFESPIYVPFVQRASELWVELEQRSGVNLMLTTGGLSMGPPDGTIIRGTRQSADLYALPYEVLELEEIRRRFPAFEPSNEMIGLLEPRMAVLFPERCIDTHIKLAKRNGADLRFDEPILAWEVKQGVASVITDGTCYEADSLVLAAGAWIGGLLSDLGLPLQIERQVVYWYRPRSKAEAFSPGECPVFIFEYDTERYLYGFPDFGDGVKVALHHQGETTDPQTIERQIKPTEIATMNRLVDHYMPDAAGTLLDAVTCMYTNTPDFHFLIDRHPEHSSVHIVSPCSGHGFKFSSAIGEMIAEKVINGASRFDTGQFGIARLLPTK